MKNYPEINRASIHIICLIFCHKVSVKNPNTNNQISQTINSLWNQDCSIFFISSMLWPYSFSCLSIRVQEKMKTIILLEKSEKIDWEEKSEKIDWIHCVNIYICVYSVCVGFFRYRSVLRMSESWQGLPVSGGVGGGRWQGTFTDLHCILQRPGALMVSNLYMYNLSQ